MLCFHMRTMCRTYFDPLVITEYQVENQVENPMVSRARTVYISDISRNSGNRVAGHSSPFGSLVIICIFLHIFFRAAHVHKNILTKTW